MPTFLVRGDVYFWGSLMGACLIASLPIAILYNLFVDRLVAGFTMARSSNGPAAGGLRRRNAVW